METVSERNPFCPSHCGWWMRKRGKHRKYEGVWGTLRVVEKLFAHGGSE